MWRAPEAPSCCVVELPGSCVVGLPGSCVVGLPDSCVVGLPGSCVVEPINEGIAEPSSGWIVELLSIPVADGNVDDGLNCSIPVPAFVCLSIGWNGAAFFVAVFVFGDGKNCASAFSTGNGIKGCPAAVSDGISGRGGTLEAAGDVDPMGRKLDLPRRRVSDGRGSDFSEGADGNESCSTVSGGEGIKGGFSSLPEGRRRVNL